MTSSIKNIAAVFMILIVVVLIINSMVLAQMSATAGNSDYYNPLDLGLDLSITSGYTNNLQYDSTDTKDSYTTASAAVSMSPVSLMEVVLFCDYTYYNKNYAQSSLSKGVTATFIPFNQDSRLSAYLSTSFSGRTYRKELNGYDNNSFDVIASLGYNLTPTWQFRSGVTYKSNAYLLTDAPDRVTYGFFAGTNITLFGNNSIDIEGGYTATDLSYIPDTTGFIRYPVNYQKGDLYSYYFSPRFSRPLGSKTGLSITYHHRHFSNGEHAVILNTGLNALSPWADLFQGETVLIKLKTRLVPDMIISSGFGYWKKTYLKTMVIDAYAAYYAETRRDEQNRLYFTFERPIYLDGGQIITPSISLEFTHNNTIPYSMFDLYDYNSHLITANFSCQF